MTTYNGESAGIADTANYRIVFEDPTTLPRCPCAFEPSKECANCVWWLGYCSNDKMPFDDVSWAHTFIRAPHNWYCCLWEAKE